MKIICIICLLLLESCGHSPVYGDRKLPAKEIPTFLNPYKSHEADFYEKITAKGKTYEVKEEGLSITYDEQGQELEREQDLKFSNLDIDLQNKIKSYLKKEFPRYKLIETERRTVQGKKVYIDIEIKHPSSNSGYWEISFTPEGEYVSKEIEDYHPLETLN